MNLILLLSALLSALSGTGGVRAPVTPAALSSSVASAVKATAVKRLQVAARPAQVFGGPAKSVVPTESAFVLADLVPAFASRRRE
ncbi:hypothetical protein FPZ24_09335 [Sphingomonas panacisoli]|uniref:Uncharacterized protein n=1 Tax=Sphingomonas panacisoli TaxID=1813879 RepID=A0A5B8LH40_9SPHN|nr:hypothetical protein [Sphingomonas panacisoli]QDZ07668.1 hypothetical protein FPZ24_09335 [Sphingomonas panacisoli]